jgi:hypothetical protein
VLDGTGASVAGASVTVASPSTALTRVVQTSSAGAYTVPALPVGTYTVTITATGFETTAIKPFELQVGQTRTIDAHLAPKGVQTEVQVSATPALEEGSATIGGVISPEQIQNLPVNGRNWTNLMALIPGAVDTGNGDQLSVRFSGRAIDDNNYRFDGVDATGIQNQSQRTSVRLQISTDAIAEFRASSALYGAEQGGSAGGQVDIVTRSGTNNFHGSIFEFLRNDVFDARRFNDIGARKPPFRLNQFGANLGGPIYKDRSFFFANFEAIRQVLGQSLSGPVPSAAYRARALAVSPALKPIFDAYPIGQLPSATDPDVSIWTGSGSQLLNETAGLGRVDHRFTDKTSGFLRFNMDHAVGDVPLASGSFYLLDKFNTRQNPYNAIASVQHLFSENILNDLKIGFNRSEFYTANESALPYAVTNQTFTALHNSLAKFAISNSFSVVDNASFIFGRHALKAGVEVRKVEINQSAGSNNDLSIAFANKADFSNNVVQTVTLNAALPTTGLRRVEEYGYIQDQYKLRSNITLTGGLRYEFYSNFHEVQGRGVVFDPRSCPPGGFCPAGSAFSFPYLLNIEPRLAASWSPFSSGQTVVTAGYGIYAGDGQLGDLNAPVNNLATREQLTGKGLSFPVDQLLKSGLSTSQTPRGLSRQRASQQIQAWSANVQQTMPRDTVLQVSYLGTKGTHLFTRTYLNGINPQTGTRPIPSLGLIDYKDNESNSNFHALNAVLRHDFHSGIFFAVNYQWSHSINDGSIGGGETLAAQNVNCRACDRASSDQDIRHYFTASTVYELPFGRGKAYFGGTSGLAGKLVSGWQLSALGTARSGSPLNILVSRKTGDLPDGNNTNQRPDLVPGVSQYAPNRSKQQWLNPAAYAVPKAGTWGNLPRNSARGPGLWQIDPAITKRTLLTERSSLVFRAESFNIFNRQQIGNPVVNLSSNGFGTIPTTVNELPTGSGTPRQLQFMVRLEF